MNGDGKVFTFAAVVCLVCSLCLSVAYSALKPRQEINKALDLRSKVLQAFGVKVVDEKGKHLMSAQEITALFDTAVEGHVLDAQGKVVEGKSFSDLTPEDINDRDKDTKLKKFYPYFVFTSPETGIARYAIHVSGMGLWSVVKGYIALENDLGTVAGLAIYDHAETPGLGGEVDKKWFSDQFPGKKLAENGKVKYFQVMKPSGTVDASSVHGPSGSTMTSQGMTRFINADFEVYHKHFSTLKGS